MADPNASRPHMPGYGLLGASEGTAEIVTDGDSIARVIALINAKYSTEYAVDFLDPTAQATVRIRPRWAFGLLQADFEGSPTRWEFDVPPTTA
jgi:hypothetical protein